MKVKKSKRKQIHVPCPLYGVQIIVAQVGQDWNQIMASISGLYELARETM